MNQKKNTWVLFALLVFAICLRLDLLGKPFIEYFGNREVQNAIPIRLFEEGRFNVFSLPTQLYDSYGSAEFPILQLVVRSFWRLLEFLHVGVFPQPGDAQAAASYYLYIAILGRLWSLLMTVAAMLCLYALLSKTWNRTAAFSALFVYALFPLSRFHDQLFIAEPTTMALSVLGIYLLWIWSENRNAIDWRFVGSALAVSFVLLLKISHASIAIPLGFIFFKKYRARAVYRWPVWLFALFVAFPAGIYYFARETHVSIGLSDMALRNTAAIFRDWKWTHSMLHDFWMRHWWVVWTPVGAVLQFVGMSVGFCQRDSAKRWTAGLLFLWSLSWLYYYIMCGEKSEHLYYQGPSAPAAAAFMGIALAWFLQIVRGRETENRRRAKLAVAVGSACFCALFVYFLTYSHSIQQHNRQAPTHWRSPWDKPPMIAGLAADRYLPPTAKIVAGSISPLQYPLFYYCHREGWFLSFNEGKTAWETPQEEAPKKLQEHKLEGAQFYVAAFLPDRAQYGGDPFTYENFDQLPVAEFLRNNYHLLHRDKYYVIYDLR